jgi:hypothetical protein
MIFCPFALNLGLFLSFFMDTFYMSATPLGSAASLVEERK